MEQVCLLQWKIMVKQSRCGTSVETTRLSKEANKLRHSLLKHTSLSRMTYMNIHLKYLPYDRVPILQNISTLQNRVVHQQTPFKLELIMPRTDCPPSFSGRKGTCNLGPFGSEVSSGLLHAGCALACDSCMQDMRAVGALTHQGSNGNSSRRSNSCCCSVACCHSSWLAPLQVQQCCCC
ncbi:hypothetical protein ABBQ32_007763 [Trebouxia sp. C0010 RCD-2024]